MSTDSPIYENLADLPRQFHVGGFHVFGTEPAPSVLLNPTYGTVILGQPLEAASLLNRLQSAAALPLLNTADFEAGVGFRIAGATAFPRAMAFGTAGDDRLAFEAGRITGLEARAIGVHVNFAPVVDVNNNARNPVIHTRSFGETPEAVGRLASAYVRGLAEGGMIATLEHFPGHGDTDVDTHTGLATIKHPRERLDQVELPPFRIGIAAGAGAVMTGDIELPALDPEPGMPTTLSRATVSGLLRRDMAFDGLIHTDSMGMNAIFTPISAGDAAVRAVKAGNDLVLHSHDDRAASPRSCRSCPPSCSRTTSTIARSCPRSVRSPARRRLAASCRLRCRRCFRSAMARHDRPAARSKAASDQGAPQKEHPGKRSLSDRESRDQCRGDGPTGCAREPDEYWKQYRCHPSDGWQVQQKRRQQVQSHDSQIAPPESCGEKGH